MYRASILEGDHQSRSILGPEKPNTQRQRRPYRRFAHGAAHPCHQGRHHKARKSREHQSLPMPRTAACASSRPSCRSIARDLHRHLAGQTDPRCFRLWEDFRRGRRAWEFSSAREKALALVEIAGVVLGAIARLSESSLAPTGNPEKQAGAISPASVAVGAGMSRDGQAQIVPQTMSRHDDACSLLRVVYSTEIDLTPDQEAKTLAVRLHPLAQHVVRPGAQTSLRGHQCNRDTIPGHSTAFNLRIGVGTKSLKVHEIRRCGADLTPRKGSAIVTANNVSLL
jgi:hypothetical protein